MSIFKCKMCGGTLEINANQTTAVCEYCGTQQTLPKLDDEKRANLYDRANHFRRNNEFDKAMSIYENILNEDSTDAEAYWSLVLCRYGIEYVEDPSTHKRIPTVNRAQFTSVFDDDNYKSALSNADLAQKALYEAEAKVINEIQKGILAISQKEKPFDVFICYKETDENGRRTQDSVLANDLYYQLTTEGFKVFFSRITLEDKLGTAYEPYIFAALNSAKVMVVLGTKPAYFNAVWVKNEWSRYLTLVKASGGKKMLVPAYKDMDPYDLPEEFSHLQAQDMSKLGFMQDLVRGIKKILEADAPKTIVKETVKETVVVNGGTANVAVASLLKRAFMFLEDGKWDSADEYCEKVLDQDPENAEAYLGKLMVVLQCSKRADLAKCSETFAYQKYCRKAMTYGDEKLKAELREALQSIERRCTEKTYQEAKEKERIGDRLFEDGEYEKAVGAYEAVLCDYARIANKKNVSKDIMDCRKKKRDADAKFREMEAQKLSDTLSLQLKTKKAQLETSRAALKKEEKTLEGTPTEETVKQNATLALGAGVIGAISTFAFIILLLILIVVAFSGTDDLYDVNTIETIKSLTMICSVCSLIILGLALKFFTVYLGKGENMVVVAIATVASLFLPLINVARFIRNSIDAHTYEGDTREKKETNIKKLKKEVAEIEVACNKLDVEIKNLQSDRGKIYLGTNASPDSKGGSANGNFFVNDYFAIKNGSIKVGDYIKFGRYEQDNDVSNGEEAIEWLVLYKQDGKVLVISKYALDCQPYTTSDTDVTWETCTLRTWLNDTFLNVAFSEAEKAKIPTVTVSADKNPEYSTNPGNATQDKVFLLSITEAEKYFKSDSARQCEATAYAEEQSAYVSSSDENFWWWLRSPGNDQDYAAFVYDVGDVFVNGYLVNDCDGAVRPALWIDLNA